MHAELRIGCMILITAILPRFPALITSKMANVQRPAVILLPLLVDKKQEISYTRSLCCWIADWLHDLESWYLYSLFLYIHTITLRLCWWIKKIKFPFYSILFLFRIRWTFTLSFNLIVADSCLRNNRIYLISCWDLRRYASPGGIWVCTSKALNILMNGHYIYLTYKFRMMNCDCLFYIIISPQITCKYILT